MSIVEFQSKEVGAFSVSKSIGEFGLHVPEGGLTEDQHNSIGELLARVSNAGAWNRGDWYNNEPKTKGGRTVIKIMTVKDKCASFGLEQKNIVNEAAVCARFPSQATRRKLSYSHFEALLKLERRIDALPNSDAKLDVDRFMHLAVAGDRYSGEWDENQKYRKQPWTVAQLTRAILIEYGELSKVETKEVDSAEHDALTEVRNILEEAHIRPALKKRILREVDTEIKAAFGQLKYEFKKQVHQAANKEREDLRYERKRLEKERAKFENSTAPLDELIPRDEFKLVLNCLHPDKVPEESKQRYAKAMGIMLKLRDKVK